MDNEATPVVRKQKTFVISDKELNLLYDKVLHKLPYFKDIDFSETIWDDCIPYLEELVKDPEPDLYICTIKNKLRLIKDVKKPLGWGFGIEIRSIIAFQLYVILYYRFREDKVYVKVRKELTEILGFFNNPNRCPLNISLEYMNLLPAYKEPNADSTAEDMLIVDGKEKVSRSAQIGLLVRLFEGAGVDFEKYSGSKAALGRLGEKYYDIPKKTIQNFFSNKPNIEDAIDMNIELRNMGIKWQIE